MSELKQAASLALRRRYAGDAAPAGRVERISLDIDVAGSRELVSFALRGDELTWSCTCGQGECRHAHAALGFLADRASPEQAAPEAGQAVARVAASDRRTV